MIVAGAWYAKHPLDASRASETVRNRPNPPVSWRAMGRAIRIGQLGCGIVGSAVLRMLARNASDIEQRLGASIEVVSVAVRHLNKERDVPPGTEALYTTDANRSEERRVGKECRSRWWRYQ